MASCDRSSFFRKVGEKCGGVAAYVDISGKRKLEIGQMATAVPIIVYIPCLTSVALMKFSVAMLPGWERTN